MRHRSRPGGRSCIVVLYKVVYRIRVVAARVSARRARSSEGSWACAATAAACGAAAWTVGADALASPDRRCAPCRSCRAAGRASSSSAGDRRGQRIDRRSCAIRDARDARRTIDAAASQLASRACGWPTSGPRRRASAGRASCRRRANSAARPTAARSRRHCTSDGMRWTARRPQPRPRPARAMPMRSAVAATSTARAAAPRRWRAGKDVAAVAEPAAMSRSRPAGEAPGHQPTGRSRYPRRRAPRARARSL